MHTKRPVHLNIMAIRMPITAIVSILHRMSGIVLCILLPVAIWALDRSLQSPGTFAALQQCLQCQISRVLLSGVILVFVYHFLAGIRHLLMDLHIGETLPRARLSAWFVFLGMGLVGVRLGFWIVGA